ncbi:hypothetical protein KGF57_001799, partial [Candida theae]
MAPLFKEKPDHVWKTVNSGFPLDSKLVGSALPLPGSEQEGFSPIYRNAYSQKELKTVPYPGITTLYDTFELCVANRGHKPALGHRVKKDDGTFG